MPCQPKGNGLEMLPSLIYLIGEKQALHLGVYFLNYRFFCVCVPDFHVSDLSL